LCPLNITNLINNKKIIGQSKDIESRWSKHKGNLRKNKHENNHLQKAWNKYGEENFIFEILEEYEIQHLISMEHYWCNLLDAFNYNKAYNIRPTHPFGKGTNSFEMREKVKKALTGKKLSEEHKLKLSLAKKGRRLSKETKQKMSDSGKGKIMSNETKKKISEAKTGSRNPMFGKVPWNKKVL
jgi:group I intron endonuclease